MASTSFPEKTISSARWLLATLLLAALPFSAVGEEIPKTASAYPTTATFDHLLFLRHNPVGRRAETTSLVLAKVTPEKFDQRDLHEKRNLHVNFAPLGVFGGKVYAVTMTDLIEIDAATGDAKTISTYVTSPVFRSGRIFALARGGDLGRALRVFDLASRTVRDVPVLGSEDWEPPLAVSPDGNRVAFFQIYQGRNTPTSFRLEMVDLKSGAVGEVGPNVFSMRFTTGGGTMTEGPPFVWLDSKTILVVRDEADEHSGPAGPGAARGVGGVESEPLVATMDVETGAMNDILRLPRFLRGLYEPYLRPLGPDGVPRAVVGNLGQLRLDLDAKQVLADNTLGGEFDWIRGEQPERLLYGETELFQADSIIDVSVSPDGRRVAWLTKGGSGADIRCFSSGDDAPRTMAGGWFPSTSTQHRRPEKSLLLWLDGKDLEPIDRAEPPAGFTPFDEEAE